MGDLNAARLFVETDVAQLARANGRQFAELLPRHLTAQT